MTASAALMVEPSLQAAPHRAAEGTPRLAQRTLGSAIDCTGTGLHSGRRLRLVMAPAPAGSGIVFHRSDSGVSIPARHDHVRDTTLCTVIGASDHPSARIGTIEHLMAALSAAGIDNASVTVDGPEVPAMDGSAAPFSFLIACAGVREQDAPLSVIEVLRPVRVKEGDASAALLPHSARGAAILHLAMEIGFDSAAIGRQRLSVALTGSLFMRDIAPARTFGFAEDLQRLRAGGLARGGSLANAVAISGDRILNPEGLRFPDEFVRHKLLDAIGDLALAGLPIRGRFVGNRSGHRINNALLRALLADSSAFRVVPAAGRPVARPAPLAADRAPAQGLAAAAA